VQRLGAEVARAMASPAMRDALSAQGAYAIAGTPAQYAAFLSAEIARFRTLADELSIRLD
jgi:tripartite-type tricarboxylate transporter receptor subunit TctC